MKVTFHRAVDAEVVAAHLFVHQLPVEPICDVLFRTHVVPRKYPFVAINCRGCACKLWGRWVVM